MLYFEHHKQFYTGRTPEHPASAQSSLRRRLQGRNFFSTRGSSAKTCRAQRCAICRWRCSKNWCTTNWHDEVASSHWLCMSSWRATNCSELIYFRATSVRKFGLLFLLFSLILIHFMCTSKFLAFSSFVFIFVLSFNWHIRQRNNFVLRLSCPCFLMYL